MAKASKPVAKAAKPKSGRAKGSGTPAWLVGAGAALIVAVLAGVFLYGPGSPAQVDVAFRNPGSGDVHLFAEPTGPSGPPQRLASLPPGGAVDLRASVGARLFFSPQESGATRRHTLTVDGSMREYSFNPGCRDLVGAARCQGFAGSCGTNPGWMAVNCAATCGMCHLLDPKVRCSLERLGLSNESVVGPGDIARMFESLPKRFPEYNVKFLSEPDNPYVATFDNFVTAEEARVIMQLTEPHLQRSTDQGSIDEATGVQSKITSTSRTSSNAWCDDNSGCSSNPVVKKLIKRIAAVVQVSEQNFEYMQVLRYGRGQEYQPHHDTSPHDWRLACGPRLYTMFLYFDEVKEGGGTSFPNLNVTVTPAQGKALLWPSLVSDRPSEIEVRTTHAALPVIEGTKLAANVWVRQRNYRHANLWGCTGSFGDL